MSTFLKRGLIQMMSLKNWFEQRRKQSTAHLDAEGMNRVEDAQYAKIWTKCVSCDAQLTKIDLEDIVLHQFQLDTEGWRYAHVKSSVK